MILKVNDGSIDGLIKSFSFTIDNSDKIGLIGLNGVGKTSLVNYLLNSKDVIKKNNHIIGYLTQEDKFNDDNNTVLEEIYSEFLSIKKLHTYLENFKDGNLEEYIQKQQEYDNLGGYTLESKINTVLYGLNFFEFKDFKISKLSGGQKIVLKLCKILLKEPDLLILDEPTNHLDLSKIEWLEDFLKKYSKSFIVISHDRDFLDNICNRIFEIENKVLNIYKGNFTDFVIQKELILKGKIKEYEKEQKFIEKTEEYILKYKAGIKSKQARGRQKLLDRFERMDDPIFNPKRMKLKFNISRQTSQNVFKIRNLSFSYRENRILNDISFDIFKGDRIGIIGKNGSGKSTLLKQIVNKNKVEYGSNLDVSYFNQDLMSLNYENSVFDEINTDFSKDEKFYRSYLSGFLFNEDDIEKKVKVLSGGEKVRLQLLKMMLEKPNVLLLDEPTNHLDIYSIEVLEESLLNYEGVIVVVSHNRHFLDVVCNKILVLDSGNIEIFNGNYEEYKKSIEKEKNLTKKDTTKKENYLNQKNLKKEYNKDNKRIENIFKRIDEINENINFLEKKKNDYAYDLSKLLEIEDNINLLKEEENNLTEEWERIEEKWN